MPSFRCQYLDKWLYKGQISQEEYDKAIKKLDGHDAEIEGQIIRDVLETVKEQNEIYLAEREKQIRTEVIDEYMNKLCDKCVEMPNECGNFECLFEDDGCQIVKIGEQLKEAENDNT